MESDKDMDFDRGYEAYAEGVSRNSNPHEPSTQEFNSWDAGWQIAKEDRSEYLYSINPLREEDYE